MKGSTGGPLQVAAGLLALALFALTSAGCTGGGYGGSGGSVNATAASGHSSTSSQPRPFIEIVSYTPLIIHGQHFRPHETVVVQAQSRQTGIRPVVVREQLRASGAFKIQLRGYGLDRCTGFTITATGSTGTRAVVRSPASGCPPVPAPST